jgi:hypothetical protein
MLLKDKRAYWDKIYRDQKKSGLSKRDYCAKEGISEGAYHSAVGRYGLGANSVNVKGSGIPTLKLDRH